MWNENKKLELEVQIRKSLSNSKICNDYYETIIKLFYLFTLCILLDIKSKLDQNDSRN